MTVNNNLVLNKITVSLCIACLMSTMIVFANDERPTNNTVQKLAVPTLDGSGNNSGKPRLGAVGTTYSRISPAAYPDGIGQLIDGPSLRYLSNRIFADSAQNLFSETGITQWAYNWGQFIDHSIGLRVNGAEKVSVSFDENDPMESFNNRSQNLTMTRSAAAPGTGISNQREHLNTVSSYIDAWAVYGGTEERLEWLREGPVDNDLSNNGAKLLLTSDGNLPPANYRGDASTAPKMEIVGRLHAIPNAVEEMIVTGDIRANENIALTTVQTLFAREHNRIVDMLPTSLSEQKKFDIARQLIIATQQYITYEEFLPALGIHLSPASNYNPDVDPSISTEFATVGYRAHSMIHGEIEIEVAANHYTTATLENFRSQGIEIHLEGDVIELAVPLNVAFANPQLVANIGVAPLAAGLGSEPQYKNDEQFDNQLRSVLFQLPSPEVKNPDECLDGPTMHECFRLANDLGSLDVFRARDHGIAPYNALRQAYGLTAVSSFTEITGEDTEDFPINDPILGNDPINNPKSLDFVELRDSNGKLLKPGSDEADAEAITGIRRTTLAARLKAIYGTVDKLDAFVGMVSEAHMQDSDFGPLQAAMWERQFEALRDGDANHYRWNESLKLIMEKYGSDTLTYKQSLADIIINNTELNAGDIQAEMFMVAE